MIIYENKIYFKGKFYELIKLLNELSLKYKTFNELINSK
ncbi:hypothetical protein Thethe_01291 [Thermoanaerobacterium thermosaccharolyticum M0795]|jgi:hypothetical protein|uniref:Uncharacterized protein n=2 Tax=Thermoanaerobacterium thermosaccharolyticum TaxID=1517 RepID=D9TQU7_THETC|nr:hypothetical protein Tthe_1326 [Thermoanaerobacterium thermosaccharolyticum DSM 571]AGB18934.1 hypothetical protein Thethe_01291 [Thermoanaerobacterium thermosaccharolyticum M0795]MCP2239290.1 hypothetical protein [Thermoanaerobacterium thermosaccharolyticum]TCW37239.1 hypothetical protein EDC21_10840 [Thermohydrogenium kirishiense]